MCHVCDEGVDLTAANDSYQEPTSDRILESYKIQEIDLCNSWNAILCCNPNLKHNFQHADCATMGRRTQLKGK